jgi:hypothetical protein
MIGQWMTDRPPAATEYERLLADGVLVLQLHHREVDHHHGRIGDPDQALGNGVLLRTPTATPSSSPAPTARRTSRDRAGSYGFTRLLAARIIWMTV